MPSAFDKQFGEELRRARQDHGMTQRGLAAKMQLLGADISENRIARSSVELSSAPFSSFSELPTSLTSI